MRSVFSLIVFILGFVSLSLQGDSVEDLVDLKCFKIGKQGAERIDHLFQYDSSKIMTVTAGIPNGVVVSKLALFRSLTNLGLIVDNYEDYKYATSVHEDSEDDFESTEIQLDSKYTSVFLFAPSEDDAAPLRGDDKIQLQPTSNTGRQLEVTGSVVSFIVDGNPESLLVVNTEALREFEFIPHETVIKSGTTTYRAIPDRLTKKEDKQQENDEENLNLDEEELEKLRMQRNKMQKLFGATWFVFTKATSAQK